MEFANVSQIAPIECAVVMAAAGHVRQDAINTESPTNASRGRRRAYALAFRIARAKNVGTTVAEASAAPARSASGATPRINVSPFPTLAFRNAGDANAGEIPCVGFLALWATPDPAMNPVTPVPITVSAVG